MDEQKLESLPPPPGVIGALRSGFDLVSSHVVLIVVPLLLDIFLWLGPRLSVQTMLGPIYQDAFVQLSLASAEPAGWIGEAQVKTTEWLQSFNLLSLVSRLQLFPVGISSLMSVLRPVDSPLGEQNVLQVQSMWVLLLYMFVLVLVGWVAGGLYFRWVSGTVIGERDAVNPLWAIFQTVLLSVVWMFAFFAISIPLVLIFTLLAVVSPLLVSAALFLLVVFSFWLIVPLFFTPHGIFIRKQNAFSSIYTSLRMARFTLPTSGMFVFTVFLLSSGLNYLWSVPSSESWMMGVGIAGHAFITTALLAASFVYYRDMNAWLQLVFENLQPKNRTPARQA